MSAPNQPTAQQFPSGPPPGRFNAVGGRFSVEPVRDDPFNRTFTRSFERRWDVTGWYSPVLAVPQANAWFKGQLLRKYSPAVKLTWYGPMYDPTDPATWTMPGNE
jgi:hypothetical protein